MFLAGPGVSWKKLVFSTPTSWSALTSPVEKNYFLKGYQPLIQQKSEKSNLEQKQ